MPFQASSLAMVQSTDTWRTSPASTQGRGRLRACAARILWVNVMGRRAGAETLGGCYMHRPGAFCNWGVGQICWQAHGHLVRAPDFPRFALPGAGGSQRAHARGRGGHLPGSTPALSRLPRADRGAAGESPAIPAAGDVRSADTGPSGLDRRDAVRPRVPRAPYGSARAGRRRGAEEAGRTPVFAGPRSGEAALGDVARG